MATATSSATERRHLPDRRTNNKPATARPMGIADWIPMLLLVIGGLNWGLVGLLKVDLIAAFLGETSALARLIYIAVGLSALYALYLSVRMTRRQA